MQPARSVHLVTATSEQGSAARPIAARDVSLVAFLFVLHAIPVVAFAMGRPWGSGVVGYATLVALVSGRETLRELRALLRPAARRAPLARP